MRFFNKISLETPESVELEFTLAGIGARAYALCVDYLILGITLIVIFVVWAIFYTQVLVYYKSLNNVISLWLFSIQILVMFVIYVGYFVFFETLWQGQTPGKKMTNIRVICDDGKQVGLAQSTLRALFRPVDDWISVGVFLIIFGNKEKRLGDWLAGTMVIQEQKGNKIENIKFNQQQQVEDLAKYLLEKVDLTGLLPEDFAVVREYLRRRDGMILKVKNELSKKLAYQLKDLLKMEEIPEGVTSNIFLEAVYLAYQKRSEENKNNDQYTEGV